MIWPNWLNLHIFMWSVHLYLLYAITDYPDYQYQYIFSHNNLYDLTKLVELPFKITHIYVVCTSILIICYHRLPRLSIFFKIGSRAQVLLLIERQNKGAPFINFISLSTSSKTYFEWWCFSQVLIDLIKEWISSVWSLFHNYFSM